MTTPVRTEQLALLADCLLVGALTTLGSLGVVTVPAAFASACALLRGRVRHQGEAGVRGYLRLFTGQLRARPRAQALAGAVCAGAVALLALDLLLVRVGLPGGGPVGVLLAVAALAVAAVALRAAAQPAAADSWTGALHSALERTRADAAGTALVAAAVAAGLAAVWMLPPLAVLVPGLLAFAAVAVEQRQPH